MNHMATNFCESVRLEGDTRIVGVIHREHRDGGFRHCANSAMAFDTASFSQSLEASREMDAAHELVAAYNYSFR